jgi:hypothetical protein
MFLDGGKILRDYLHKTPLKREAVRAIVSTVLSHRSSLPANLRELIGNHIRAFVELNGFRDSSRGPTPLLVDPLTRTCSRNKAVMKTFIEGWVFINEPNITAAEAFCRNRNRGASTEEELREWVLEFASTSDGLDSVMARVMLQFALRQFEDMETAPTFVSGVTSRTKRTESLG